VKAEKDREKGIRSAGSALELFVRGLIQKSIHNAVHLHMHLPVHPYFHVRVDVYAEHVVHAIYKCTYGLMIYVYNII
jgi:uncharacterized protein YdhG (YjbR/CyaY superfamily)